MEHTRIAHGTTVGLSVPISLDHYKGLHLLHSDPNHVDHVTCSIAGFLYPHFPALGFKYIHSCSTKCNVSAKIWNMLELHTAQLLDYLSQFPWIIPKANTWPSMVLYRLYSHIIYILIKFYFTNYTVMLNLDVPTTLFC